MPLYFQRPENALKRANEFIDVGEKQWALDALYDVIKSRKHRTWQKIHEPIMSKYLELCVELKKSHVAKEGLFQYRNICQQVNIKSLEDVVRGYLQLAEDKTEAARAESQLAVVDVDDLDQVQTPENLLLSAVSSEDTKDRTDRIVLTPWVKFLWESYRQSLELLRNNSRVERLYHDIAQQAFKFCLKYNRKTEFRKLCDNLRAHLGHIHKHQNMQTSVNMNNPDSQAMHLETRLVQLDSAIQMELWQEAYKAIEDVHGLMNMSKKAPNPRLMANYYQKLSLVFSKSHNRLFHAAALFRLFHLSREQKKNITHDEIAKMAARVVLATLAIPIPPNRAVIDRLVETDENVIDKNHRVLSTLLGLPNPPSRVALLKDLVRFGIINCAPAELQDLYRCLETEFHPLKLYARVQQSFDFLNKWEDFPELKQYIPSIQDITIVRLVKEISQVYETIRFSRLLELVPFVTSFNLEYQIVEVSRRNDLQVRIDHKKECFHFGSELNVSEREEIISLQSMPSEKMRNQLVFVHSVLKNAVFCIQPGKLKNERKDLSKEIVKAYNLTSSKDHMRILNRQQIIEERKEMLENLNYQKEAEERKILLDKEKKLREAEKERMARETEERVKNRMLKEQSELKRKVVLEKIEQLKKTEIGCRIIEGMDECELEKLDPEDLLNKQVEQLDKERKDLESKLTKQERKVDHLERAKRIDEIPLLESKYLEYKEKDIKFWEQYEKERIKAIKEERIISVQFKERLMRLKEDRDKFLERLKQARSSIYQDNLSEFKKVLEEERKNRLAERKLKRREERRAAWIKEQEEKRELEIDEQLKREREEERAKLAEIEAKKQAKDREIEERLRREQENAALERKRDYEDKGRGFLRNESDKPPQQKSFSNWREREQEKRQSWGAPQEKPDKEQDDPNEELQDGKKSRTEEPLRKVEDRIQNDDWRKRDVYKPKEDDKGAWRRDDRSSSRRDDRPKEERDDRSGWRREDRPKEERDDRSGWRRDDRPKEERDDRSGWRRDDRPKEERDDRSGWRRDDKSKEERDEKSGWRREDRPKEEDRKGVWRREERPKEERDERSAWRRDEKPKEERDDRNVWRRDDKPKEEKDDRNIWRRDDRSSKDRDEREKSTWRRDDKSLKDDKPLPVKDEKGAWRRDDRPKEAVSDKSGWRERKDDKPSFQKPQNLESKREPGWRLPKSEDNGSQRS